MKAKKNSKSTPIQQIASPISQKPYWLLAIWLVLTCVWSLALFGQPLGQNLFRWTLFLVPDQAIAGWFDGPVTIEGMIDRVSVWLVAAAHLLIAATAGQLVLRKTYLFKQLRRSERFALSITVGLALFASVLLVVGLLGLIRSVWGLPITIGSLLAISALIGTVLQRSSAMPTFPATANSEDLTSTQPAATTLKIDHFPRFLAIVFAALIIAKATLPPAEYDVREYHLQAPKEWWLNGAITFLPHNIYANMPMAAEIHSLFTMMTWNLLGSDSQTDAWWWGAISGKVIIACFAIWMSILAGGCVRILSIDLHATTADALCAGRWMRVVALAFPAIVEVSSLGLIEAPIACFFAAGLLALCCRKTWDPINPFSASELETTAIVSLMAGAAIACKYPAVVLILPLLYSLWAFELGPHTSNFTSPVVARLRNPKMLGVWFVGIFIGGGLWYLKNAVVAENPVYPLAAQWLGGRTLSPDKIAQWNAGHATPSISSQALFGSVADILWRWRLQGWAMVPLAAAGFVHLVFSRHRKLCYALLASSTYVFLVWWFATHRVDRFLIPAVPLAILFAGIGWTAISAKFDRRWATWGISLLLVLNVIYISGPALGDSRLLVSLRYLRADDLSQSSITRLPEHVRVLNQHLEPSDSVLIVGDAAVFDFNFRVTYSTTFDRSPLTELTANPNAEWPTAFASSHYDYLLMHWGEIARLRSTYGFEPSITPDLVQSLVDRQIITPVSPDSSDGRWQLFRINRHNSHNEQASN